MVNQDHPEGDSFQIWRGKKRQQKQVLAEPYEEEKCCMKENERREQPCSIPKIEAASSNTAWSGSGKSQQ